MDFVKAFLNCFLLHFFFVRVPWKGCTLETVYLGKGDAIHIVLNH